MGQIWVKEFVGGLDTRRMPETTPGGALVQATNGHITRGGEFEKRAAFVPTYTLPAGTVSMAFNETSIVVFGSAVEPLGLPVGVVYQRLQHPDESVEGYPALVSVPSFDLYSGKIYAVGLFADGSLQHFYDGVRVEDWYDGRATAVFRVAGGAPTPAVAASADLLIEGASPGATIDTITAGSTTIFSGALAHTGDNPETAEDLADAINLDTGTHGYIATVSGSTVTIETVAAGDFANGRTITVDTTGTFDITPSATMAGGANQLDATIFIRVAGVAIMDAPVTWAVDNGETADDIVAAIVADLSSPEYTALAVGEYVVIIANDSGADANGRSVTFELANGFTVTPSFGLTMTGGSDGPSTTTPGTFVKTVGSKVYAVSGQNLHFSGIREPTKWTTDAVGAGFIDMAAQASGSEALTAIAKYQQWLAVFAENSIQIEYVDPDPALNRQVQVLANTGTLSPRSVTQFGDNDIFYLHESGLRSLQARDSSNSAASFDLGNPIDGVLAGKLAALSIPERASIIGLIEPLSGRFWLCVKDTVFVFSSFNRGQINAWSVYTPSYFQAAVGETPAAQVPFDIDDAVIFRRRVYVRSGNRVLVYGGLASGTASDDAVAEAWLPFLDADDPAQKKSWTSVDAALQGTWRVDAAMEPTQPNAQELVATLLRTTYSAEKIPLVGQSSHIGLRFRTVGSGPARLGAVIIHYEGGESEG